MLGLVAAFLYGITSVSITFFNKAVVSVYHFNFSNTLTLGQMICALLFLVVMKQVGIVTYADFQWSTAKQVFSLALAFNGMVISGLAPLYYVNVPMYGALRRITTFIVMIGERIILGRQVAFDEALSIYLMVFGAIIAGAGDISFSMIGYLLIMANCVITALYLILIAKKSKETRLDTFGLMFYNNLLSLPFVVILVLFTEAHDVQSYDKWQDWGFLSCFLLSSVQAFLLNYFIFMCSTINSPLTTSITGQLKNILQTILGLFLFGDVEATPLLVGGLSVSTIASLWYAVIKYRQSAQPKDRKENPV